MLGFRQDNILLSNIRPYFKKIWFANKSGGCSNDVLVFEVNNGFNAKFLYYVLSDNNFFNYSTLTSKGTKMPRGTKSAIMKYLVPKVSNTTQQHIASILSSYDDLIEKNNRKIAVLQEQAQEIYKEWFVRFRFPGYKTAQFEKGLPVGWEYRTVESLSSILRRGISPKYDDNGNLVVISQKCIRTNIMDIRESRRQVKTFSKELNLIDGDTVICSTGTGTLGRVGEIFGEYLDTTFDSHVTLVRAKKGISKEYLFFALKNLQIWLMNMGIGSTNQQELYRSTIRNAKILFPGTDLMGKFDFVTTKIHKEIVLLCKQTALLINQRELLLPRLISGKLKV